MAKEKKVETKTKKIINIVVMTIEILIIIAGIALSISVIFGSKTKSDELEKGYNITTVLTDSMNGNITTEFEVPSFKPKSDLLVIKAISEDERKDLKVGDVITYLGRVSGEAQLISHRIIKIDTESAGGMEWLVYYTLGDKQRTGDEVNDFALSTKIPGGNIQGKVVKKISGVGGIIYWFQEDPNHFLLSVVIPLALLLIYNVYVFIKMIVDYRIKKTREEGQMAVEAIKAQSSIDEEEIKRKAIEEYLAQQANAIKDEAETKDEAIKIGDSEEK